MKKRISLFLALVMLLSLFAGLSINTYADSAALTVYTQTGDAGTPVAVKSYTAAELNALKETSAGTSYVFYKKDTESTVTATEYVTLSALLTDAGVTFAAGDKLSFTCEDGPYSKGDFSYESLSARGVDATGAAVPTAFALTWATDKAGTGIRFVCGMTETEKTEKTAAGNRMPSGIVAVTVVTPKLSVQLTNQALKVDGTAKKTEIYNINGSNYFKLRDIAMLLNGTAAQFSVGFDANKRLVSATTGAAYQPNGGELSTGKDKSASCVASSWTIQVNGETKTITAYNIGGNNFFKLRDLGEALGFGVNYDEASRTMLVTSK